MCALQYYVPCATILGCVRYYIRLRAPHYKQKIYTFAVDGLSGAKNIYFQTLLYAFAVDGLACRTIQCVHYGVRLRLRGPWGEGA